MPVRDRANTVCTECHSRKIKCDLQTTQEGACRNCRRSHQSCIPRHSLRKRRAGTRLQESTSRSQIRSSPDLLFTPANASITSVVQPESGGNPPGPLSQHNDGFLSVCAKQYYGEHSEMVSAENSLTDSLQLRDKLFKLLQADTLPRPTLSRAWTDAYMAHAFHHCPVVEQKDITGSSGSLMLQKAIGLIGVLMKHDPNSPKLADEMYEVLKMLIYMNHEQDRVQTLKAICLVSLYSSKPSNLVGLDGPWHWIGVATRQMIQIGLYRESTYASRSDAGCLRRIFWHLHNSDSFQVACWGRPPLLKRKDFDVRLPTLEDFEVPNIQSLAFIASTKLCTILSRISELHQKRRLSRPEEIASIEIALCDWMLHLPDDLRLYDETRGRKPYCRPASEVMIQYFTTIIFNEILRNMVKDGPLRMSIPSLIAASCAVALYDEIHCRNEAIFLPWNTGCSCLVIALPLIHHIPQSPSKEVVRSTELGVLRSIMVEMRGRYGDSNMVIRMMQGLEKSVDRMPRQGRQSGMTQEPCIRANELFPFPPTLCENMDFLELASGPVDQYTAENFTAFQNQPTDEAIFDFTLMDLFGLDNSDMDFSFVDETSTAFLGEQPFV